RLLAIPRRTFLFFDESAVASVHLASPAVLSVRDATLRTYFPRSTNPTGAERDGFAPARVRGRTESFDHDFTPPRVAAHDECALFLPHEGRDRERRESH